MGTQPYAGYPVLYLLGICIPDGCFISATEKTTNSLIHTLSQKEKSEILSIPLDYPFMKNEEKLALIERFKQHAGVKEILYQMSVICKGCQAMD